MRYVIDFYRGAQTNKQAAMSIFLDVRPAVDSYQAVVDRASHDVRQWFGIGTSNSFFAMKPKIADISNEKSKYVCVTEK